MAFFCFVGFFFGGRRGRAWRIAAWCGISVPIPGIEIGAAAVKAPSSNHQRSPQTTFCCSCFGFFWFLPQLGKVPGPGTEWTLLQRQCGILNLLCREGTPPNGICVFLGFFCLLFYFIFRATPAACGDSQDRDQIRAVACGPQHSHSNARSKQHLRPTPQLTATPDP